MNKVSERSKCTKNSWIYSAALVIISTLTSKLTSFHDFSLMINSNLKMIEVEADRSIYAATSARVYI
jgi:hypothetical protein